MSNCFVASTVLAHEEEWIEKLYDRRSQLIHYKMDVGSAAASQDLLADKRELTVYAPSKFVDEIGELSEKRENHHVTLRFAAFWLVESSIHTAYEITKDLRTVIERNREIVTGETHVDMPEYPEDQ